MAITSHVFPITMLEFFLTDAQLNWETGGSLDWRAQLVQESYTPDAAHNFLDDVTTATGSATVADLTVTDPTHEDTEGLEFDVSDATLNMGYVTDTQVVNGLIVYDYNAGGATSTQKILCICEFTGSSVTGDGSNDVIITPAATGLWRITYVDF
jgi:hypothetical protein